MFTASIGKSDLTRVTNLPSFKPIERIYPPMCFGMLLALTWEDGYSVARAA